MKSQWELFKLYKVWSFYLRHGKTKQSKNKNLKLEVTISLSM